MPKILFIFLACLVLAGGSQAQNVQWASEVLEFSSQLSDKQYSAQQILHKPNVLPNTGESPNAWTPRNPNSIEFIKVGYENPMPKILFICLACLVLAGGSQAQNVQWASEVLEFSSQLSDKQYSAQQILHKPNVLPNTGESPNAWTPRNPNSIEFIKVGYENPMPIQQIAIGESYN